MEVNGRHYQSVSFDDREGVIEVIDQRLLPFEFHLKAIRTVEEATEAIVNMTVRGAPAIGMLAAWGVHMAVRQYGESPDLLLEKCRVLKSCRPTAVNLAKGVDYVLTSIKGQSRDANQSEKASHAARSFCESEIAACRTIGEYGLKLLSDLYNKKKSRLNILTHCNAGWLACGDWGTALSPVFLAKRFGIPVHVWVDETRPRNQGANLTAWELYNEKIPFTIIPDNSGGLLMQQNEADVVITGADRIAANGDTANKTGTYLKALAASDNHIPFYVAAPVSTFDFSLDKGVHCIPVEIRDGREISVIKGKRGKQVVDCRIIPEEYPVLNHAFDITPARLISGYITEKGIFAANQLKQVL
jgi:methylthioribose-1-phosphate isomerase